MFCNYHQNEAARWACNHCQRNFCEECVPAPYHIGRGRYPKCTLCNQRLYYLGNASSTHNLFVELPKALAYPLKLPLLGFALITSSLLALMHLLLANLASALAIMVPPLLLSAILVMELASAIIRQRHAGSGKAPPLSSGAHFENALTRSGQLLLLFFIVVSMSMAFGHSVWMGVTIAALISLPLPAILLIQARDNSILSALKPQQIYAVAATLGYQYPALWLCTTAALCSVISILWSTNSLFQYTLLLQYTVFASSALIGYALHRFQRELHCQVPVNTPLELDSKEAFTRARLFADNHILLAEGREDEARQLLRQSIDRAPGDLERQMAYQSILIRLKDRTALNNYAHHLTPIMLKSGDQKMCCRWFLQVRTLLADWTPEQPEHRKQLAEYLLSQHHRAVAEELLAAKNPA